MKDIQTVFDTHYSNYKNSSVENIKRDARGLMHVISDYEGRVVFELLQNAFDRAEKQIGVFVKNNTLYVGNDGKAFTYVENFDYENGNNDIRGDFQSICSIFTSTKTTANSIGNKGIGFKSTFSIAKNQDSNNDRFPTRFVELYTKGSLVRATEKKDNIFCAFRLYELIRNTDSIKIIDDSFASDLQIKIANAQKEYKDVGIPGYYFPIPLNEDYTSDYIKQLLETYVTVVAIPLESEEVIKLLIKENLIDSGIHFNFIQLKYPKPFEIKIDIDGKIWDKQVEVNSPNLAFYQLDSEEIRNKAIKAGIEIEKISIGLSFRDDDKGKFYNYLPTEISSPLKYIDIHADFRTTLNRTSINWDGAVGEYNKSLLRATFELFFALWDKDSILNFKYIDKTKIRYNDSLSWDMRFLTLKITSEGTEYWQIRSILNIGDWHYNTAFDTASDYLTRIFVRNEIDNYEKFYRVLSSFVCNLASDYYMKISRTNLFFESLKKHFDKYEFCFLPNIISKVHEDIFFKEEDQQINIPPEIKVKTTSIKIENQNFSSVLGIKKLNDLNEMIKHFRQTTLTGQFSEKSICEESQIDILCSLFSLFKRKNEKNFETAHRFERAYTSKLRDENSVLNQANFSVSTLFLKLKSGKYTPAQLCRYNELDKDFLAKITDSENELEIFLNFLGVSFSKETIVADSRIYEVFQHTGLSYIPKPVGYRKDDNISRELTKYIQIINLSKKSRIHPALLNDNYQALFVWSRSSLIKNNSHFLRIKNYENFNSVYFEILLNHLKENLTSQQKEIERFFSANFSIFHKYNALLIRRNGQLSFVKIDDDFIVLKTKSDIENVQKNENITVLLHPEERGILNDDKLKKKILNAEYSIVNSNNLQKDSELIDELWEKLPYILYKITNWNNSQFNFSENDYGILEKINQLSVFFTPKLEVKNDYGKFCFVEQKSFYNHINAIYLDNNASNSDKAKSLSLFLFNNLSFAGEFELLFFHKEASELQNELGDDLATFLQKYDKRYSSVLKEFYLQIKEKFQDIDIEDNKWYYYNKLYKSKSLSNYYQDKTKLLELKKYIEFLKSTDDFNIIINFKLHIDEESGKNLHNFNDESDKKTTISVYEQFKTFQKKNADSLDLSGGTPMTVNSSRKRFVINKSNGNNGNDGVSIESVGLSGENDVLFYLINQLLLCDNLSKAIQDMYSLGFEIIKETYFTELRNKLLESIDSKSTKEEVVPLLIDFMHIAKKYKYAFVDLIGYMDGKPYLFEIKSTLNDNNKTFYLSKAETQCAQKYENYQIVRCSPSKILFLGNPINEFTDFFRNAHNGKIEISATNYKITYHE